MEISHKKTDLFYRSKGGDEMQNNAYFQLKIKDDGTYLMIAPASEEGVKLQLSEIRHYLSKINIDIFSTADVSQALVKALETQHMKSEVKICEDSIVPVNETAVVSVSRDKMSADIRFYPPSDDGARLDKDGIIKILANAGIEHGIIEVNIDQWLDERCFCTDVQIALGTPPEESRDAVIEYLFETLYVFRPSCREDGSIDFHELNLLNDVAIGDKLAILTPEYQGEFGTNVLGGKLPSRKPQKKAIKHGKNTELSDDGFVLKATTGGCVELEHSKIVVHDVYNITGNVGSATGDVDFDGIVRISGDVQAGYTVKATKDIFVMGVVEGATLVADRDIIIANGVHGAGKADITAGGDITVNFIQEGLVSAGGSVHACSILFSVVKAKDSIIVSSKKGLVKGGELSAKTLISVKNVGSAFAGAHTQLTVGSNPEDTSVLRDLEMQIDKKRDEQARLNQALSYLSRKKECGSTIEPEQEKLLEILPSLLVTIEEDLNKCMLIYNGMLEGYTMNESGKIIIEGVVYEGSSIEISNASYYIQEDLAQCQFVKKGKEIEITSL